MMNFSLITNFNLKMFKKLSWKILSIASRFWSLHLQRSFKTWFKAQNLPKPPISFTSQINLTFSNLPSISSWPTHNKWQIQSVNSLLMFIKFHQSLKILILPTEKSKKTNNSKTLYLDIYLNNFKTKQQISPNIHFLPGIWKSLRTICLEGTI